MTRHRIGPCIRDDHLLLTPADIIDLKDLHQIVSGCQARSAFACSPRRALRSRDTLGWSGRLAGGALPESCCTHARRQGGYAGVPLLPQGPLAQDLEHQSAGAGQSGI